MANRQQIVNQADEAPSLIKVENLSEEQPNSADLYAQLLEEKLKLSEEKMDQEVKSEEIEPENDGKMDIERRKNQVFFKLCILNRISFRELFQWINQLKSTFEMHSFNRQTSFQKLQFHYLEKGKVYLCSFETLSSKVVCLKVRDQGGAIVMTKRVESDQVLRQVYFVSKLLKDNIGVFIDEKGDQEIFEFISQNKSLSNIVYIHRDTFKGQFVTIKGMNYVYKNVKGWMLFCPKKLAAKINSSALIDQFINYELQDKNNITQLFGKEYALYLRKHDDWYCLTINFIRSLLELAPAYSFDNFRQIIDESLGELNTIAWEYELHKNNHMPVNLPGNDTVHCSNNRNCKKVWKKARCQACSLLNGEQIYLCINKCYRQYHRPIEHLNKEPHQLRSSELTFFNFNIKEITKTASRLATNPEGRDLLHLHSRYLGVRIAKCLNMIAYKKEEEREREEFRDK